MMYDFIKEKFYYILAEIICMFAVYSSYNNVLFISAYIKVCLVQD